MKKTLAIILAVCLIAAALPIGMLSVTAAAPVWVREDTAAAIQVGDVIPAKVVIRNTAWVEGEGQTNILFNGAGGLTTNGAFSRPCKLKVIALTPKLSLVGVYKIDFVTDGGTLSNTDEYEIESQAKFPSNLPTATKSGYKFLYWEYDGSKVTTSTTVSQYEYGSSIKLTAVYEATDHTTGEDTWELNGTVLTISGNGKTGDYSSAVKAPWGTNITKVIISEGVTALGKNLFAGCTKLSEVELPKTLTSINFEEGTTTDGDAYDYRTFKGCTGLTKITVASGNSKYASADGALLNAAKTELLLVPAAKTGSYTAPSTVKTVGAWAFENSKLTSISLPAGVTTLGKGAFGYCQNITQVEVPAGVTSTNNYVFYQCPNLETLIIHKELKTVGPMFAFGSPIKSILYTGTSANASAMTIGGWANITTATKDNINPNNTIAWTYEYVTDTPTTTTYKISGTATTKAKAHTTDSTTVQLLSGSTVLKTATVNGTSGSYEFTDVEDGTYTVKFIRPYHADRSYTVTVSGANATQNGTIQLKGDVTGDGQVNMVDFGPFNAHIRQTSILKDYTYDVANIDGKGTVNMVDLGRLIAHLGKKSVLY